MPKTKISEFSATPANNTDIDSINIAEGCAPSGINDAIRELMSQLKDFQTGAVGDSFNGPVGSTTASTGAFTTLSASSTVSGTGFSTYLASPPAIGGTAAAAVSATTLAASGAVTLSGGTANGVTYLNGSKVLTSGSALTFDGTNLGLGVSSPAAKFAISSGTTDTRMYIQNTATGTAAGNGLGLFMISTDSYMFNYNGAILFGASGFETMRLTSTGLGIGTSSPRAKLDVSGSVLVGTYQTSTNYAPLSVKTASTITTPSTFTNAISIWNGTNVGEYSNITFGYNTAGVTNAAAYMGYVSTSSTDQGKGALVFGTRDVTSDTAASERMRLDSAGNLGLGVTPSAWGGSIKALEGYSTSGSWSIASGGGLGSALNIQSNAYYDGSNWIYKSTSPAANYYQSAGTHVWRTAASGTAGNAISFTQAMTLDASGNLLVGKTSASLSVVGTHIYSTGQIYATASASDVIRVNRLTDDGELIGFYQDSTKEGNISVSGTTVSYNGGHLSRYAQTTTVKDDSLLKGTVLSNLDEMNVYTKDGQPVANEQLNKVKVSDAEGDVNVAGVFVNWSHDEDHNVDEINMAMTGDMIIRIAQGVTVVRGDLLMSAGDGTAKPQGDDIIRSKTVAKVTSNHVTCTYADGSYCVPCVLMAC